MYRPLLFLLLSACLFSCATHKKGKYPQVEISTLYGDIDIELYPDRAPKTVAAFLSYVDSGFYENSSFYRVLKEQDQPTSAFKAELIQGGIWQTNNKKMTSLKGIPHETTLQSKLSHINGVISMARIEPGSATTEFFICVGDQPGFDYGGLNNPDGQGFAAFGRVVKGMDVVIRIHDLRSHGDAFDKQVDIFGIRKL